MPKVNKDPLYRLLRKRFLSFLLSFPRRRESRCLRGCLDSRLRGSDGLIVLFISLLMHHSASVHKQDLPCDEVTIV